MIKAILITCHKVTSPLVHTVNYFSSFHDNRIFIHVDKNSDFNDFLFLKKTNVVLIQERVRITWGGWSQVLATINLLKAASNIKFDYLFLISGDDIPLISNHKFDVFLNKNEGVEFIHFQDSRNKYVNPNERVKYVYPSCFFNREQGFINKLSRLQFSLCKDLFYRNKSYYQNLALIPKLYKGTNWFGLTSNACDYILNYIDGFPLLKEIFKSSLCADEVFFHTILKTNESFIYFEDRSKVNNALRYIDWESGPEYPKVLQHSDEAKMINSGLLFARKIPENENPEYMLKFLQG